MFQSTTKLISHSIFITWKLDVSQHAKFKFAPKEIIHHFTWRSHLKTRENPQLINLLITLELSFKSTIAPRTCGLLVLDRPTFSENYKGFILDITLKLLNHFELSFEVTIALRTCGIIVSDRPPLFESDIRFYPWHSSSMSSRSIPTVLDLHHKIIKIYDDSSFH